MPLKYRPHPNHAALLAAIILQLAMTVTTAATMVISHPPPTSHAHLCPPRCHNIT